MMNQYLTIERKNDQYPVNIIRRGLLKHGKNLKLKELHHAYKISSIEMEKLKRMGKIIPKAKIVIQQDKVKYNFRLLIAIQIIMNLLTSKDS